MGQQPTAVSGGMAENQQFTYLNLEEAVVNGSMIYRPEILAQWNSLEHSNNLSSAANDELNLSLSATPVRHPLPTDRPSGHSNDHLTSILVESTHLQTPGNESFAFAFGQHNDGVFDGSMHGAQGDFELFRSSTSSSGDMSDELIDMLLGTDEEVSTPVTDVSEASSVRGEGQSESVHDNDGDFEMQTATEDPNQPCSHIVAVWCRPPLPPGLRSARARLSRRSRKSNSDGLIPAPKALFRRESMSPNEVRERNYATVNFHHDRVLRYRVFKRSSLARETILRRTVHVSSKLTYYSFEYRVRGGNGIQGDDTIGDGLDGEGRRLCEGCGDTVCLWENMTPVIYASESSDGLGSWSDLSSSTSSVEGIPDLEGVRLVMSTIESGVSEM